MIITETADTNSVKDICRIENECFSRPWSESSIYELVENPNALVIVSRENGVCTGYVGAHIIVGECEITNIAVLPEYRGRGTATALLDRLIAEARRLLASCVSLEVRESNAAARELYKKFCFREQGRRKGYYTAPAEDAIILRADI